MATILSTILLFSLFSASSSLMANIRFANSIVDEAVTVSSPSTNFPSVTLNFSMVSEYYLTDLNDQSSFIFTNSTGSAMSTPLYIAITSNFTTLIILIQNGVFNLIPFNETQIQSMANNSGSDPSGPSYAWVRLINLDNVPLGGNTQAPLAFLSVDWNLFSYVAYLEATPFVEVPLTSSRFVIDLNGNGTSASFALPSTFLNSTAYTVFIFPNALNTLAVDRYVPYTYIPSITSGSLTSSDSSMTSGFTDGSTTTSIDTNNTVISTPSTTDMGSEPSITTMSVGSSSSTTAGIVINTEHNSGSKMVASLLLIPAMYLLALGSL